MAANGATPSLGISVRAVADDLGFETGPPGGVGVPGQTTFLNAQPPSDTAAWTPQQFDQHCDTFEEALRRGEQPVIGDFLSSCPKAQRASLFAELMEVELELCPGNGETSAYRGYLNRYPQFAGVIETIAFKHGMIADATDAASDESEAMGSEGLQQIAHFQLQEKLGAGGMGEVWRAWDTRLSRTVAVKIPRNRELTNEELHRFLREGRAAAQLRHANIVPVHEVGRAGKLAYIVSDYIEGQSLQQYLDSSRPAPCVGAASALWPLCGTGVFGTPQTQTNDRGSRRSQRACDDAAQLCLKLTQALHHAHEHGIVHRDLKPGNVLISADGEPHVVDFGIAKWADDAQQLTLTGWAMGTPAYMSPEQAAGNSAEVDRRTDVYALGAILYRMLTGRATFEGNSIAAVLRSVLDETPAAPRSIDRAIPRDLETICIKAMDKNPARRYATAEAMGNDLARFLAGEPIVGRRPGLLEKTFRLVRKRPAATAAMVLGVVAVSAFAIVMLLARENRSLLGLVPVHLETNPAGARVAFVPLHKTTQEPDGDKAIYPSTRSPVDVKLKPGDYLVVAALKDGRFHEVFRHVPNQPSTSSSQLADWSSSGDGIAMRTIDIPSLSVTAGMALVEPNVASAATSTSGQRPDPFFMDVRETSYRDCPTPPHGEGKISGERDVEVKRKIKPDYAATVSFGLACRIAENMGKRLPTAGEFYWAASQPNLSTCDGAAGVPAEFGPVGTPDCDRVGRAKPIFGLHSNVAEWTTTALRRAEQNNATFKALDIPQIALFRIVKGGSMAVVEGNPTLALKDRDPAGGFGIERYRSYPGLGFRCVRSAYPRFLPKE